MSSPASSPASVGQPTINTHFRYAQEGKGPEDGLTLFHLGDKQYGEFKRLLSQDSDLSGFVEGKLSCDYDGQKEQLIVRSPSLHRETLVARIENNLFGQIEKVSTGTGPAASFAKELLKPRAGRAPFSGLRHPDATFWHKKAAYPGVILKILLIHNNEPPQRLAKEYLLASSAGVKVVVGIEIDYSQATRRRATLLHWKLLVAEGGK